MAANEIHIIQENASSDFVDRILSGVASGKVIIINASNLPELRALGISDVASLQAALDAKISATEKGIANGIATLGASGKVPPEQLDIASIFTNKGAWNANTNTPTIPQATSSNNGWCYQVSVAGSTVVDGNTEFEVGDLLISNGTTWYKIDNTDQVISVAGRKGAIVLTKADVGLSNVVDALQFLASNVDTDTALTANSDTKVASQKAVKAWVTSYSAPIAHNHDANYEPKNTNIQLHIADTTVHVTSSDKTNWNGKLSWGTVPASATSSGTAGQIAFEDDYLYLCVASNKWKRFIGVTF